MSSDDPKNLQEAIANPVKQTQLIVFALAAGPLFFALIILGVLRPEAGEVGAPDRMLSNIAMIAGLAAVFAQTVVGNAVTAAGVKRWAQAGGGDPAPLAQVHQLRTIVTSAITEGAAFLNLVVYGFIIPDAMLLAMAGLLIVVNATKFPTVAGVADWIKRQARAASEEGMV